MFTSLSSIVWGPETEGADPCPGNVRLDDSKVTEDGWVYVEETVIVNTDEISPVEPEQDATEKTSLQILFGEDEDDIAEQGQSSADNSKTSSFAHSENVSSDTSLQVLFDESHNSGQEQSDCSMETAEGSPGISRQISLQFPFDEDLQIVNNELEHRPSTSQTTTVTIDGGCEFEFVLPTPITSTTTAASTEATTQPRRPIAHAGPPIREQPRVSMRITRSQRRFRLAMELGAHASEKRRMPLTRSQTAALRRSQRDTRQVKSARSRARAHGKRKKRLNQTADKHSGRGGRRGC